MTKYREIPWPRIAAEGAVIVVSILMAFAIDTWWQDRTKAEEAHALLVSLRVDFQASQSHVEVWLAGNKRILRASTDFLDQLRNTGIDEELLVPIDWLVATIGAPTYSPTDSTLRTAISSGQIELIEDVELRTLLAKWSQQLDDTQEDEILIREIVVNQLVPAISKQIRLGLAFDFDTIVNWFAEQADLDVDQEFRIRATTILEGALAERTFYENFVVGGLEEIETTQAEILRLLDKEIAKN